MLGMLGFRTNGQERILATFRHKKTFSIKAQELDRVGRKLH